MPRNEAPDNTVMKDVPPGDETGIYYILLGGVRSDGPALLDVLKLIEDF